VKALWGEPGVRSKFPHPYNLKIAGIDALINALQNHMWLCVTTGTSLHCFPSRVFHSLFFFSVSLLTSERDLMIAGIFSTVILVCVINVIRPFVTACREKWSEAEARERFLSFADHYLDKHDKCMPNAECRKPNGRTELRFPFKEAGPEVTFQCHISCSAARAHWYLSYLLCNLCIIHHAFCVLQLSAQ